MTLDLDRLIYIDLRDPGATYLREKGLDWIPEIGRWVDAIAYEYLKSLTPEERDEFIAEAIRLGPQPPKENKA